ncbi:MAG: GGDEF domain-containing protein [Hydrogenophaga sp.]|nr:GGDEF domain-containing protein [Hydrogenophaga sp.]
MDLLTVVTYNSVINFVIAIIATVAWWRHSQQKDMVFWLLTTWFMVIGGACTSLTGLLPYNILGYLGGMIYVARTGFMGLAFKAFYRRPHRVGEALYVSVAVFVGMVLAEALDDPAPVRISLVYIGSAINLALCARVLWDARAGEWLPSGRLAAYVLGAYALSSVVISPLAILYPVQFVDRVPVSDWMGYTSVLLLIFNMLSFLMAMVLKLERSGETQRQLAERDGLTGLLNRRMFLAQAQTLAQNGPAAIAVLDLDHFKSINDTFGHKGGDDALMQFAERVTRGLPPGALFGRLGGEEFGICLPGHDRASALAVLERLRHMVSHQDIRSGDRAFVLTFSCGFTVMDDPARSLDAWMADADAGLYAAKSAGRDRVVAHEPETSAAIFAGVLHPLPELSRLSA